MKKASLAIAFVSWLTLGTPRSAQAESSHYVLDVQELNRKNDSLVVRLRHRVSRRVIWSRRVDGGAEPQWSKDGRAVAVKVMGGRRLFVWREGYRLREFTNFYGDYFMGCVWSPDKRRLLVQCGLSADVDFGAGMLFCLRLGLNKRYHIAKSHSYAHKMAWRDSRTALYWPVDGQRRYLEKPREWRVP